MARAEGTVEEVASTSKHGYPPDK